MEFKERRGAAQVRVDMLAGPCHAESVWALLRI